MTTSVKYIPLEEVKEQKNICSFCSRVGHLSATCLARRQALQDSFSVMISGYDDICGFLPLNPTHWIHMKNRPFVIRKKPASIFIRLFPDLFLRIFIVHQSQENKARTKFVAETVVKTVEEYRKLGYLQTSANWWSNDNWLYFLLVIETLMTRLSGVKRLYPKSLIVDIPRE